MEHTDVNIDMLFDNSVITPCSINSDNNVVSGITTQLLINGVSMDMGVKVLWLLYVGMEVEVERKH